MKLGKVYPKADIVEVPLEAIEELVLAPDVALGNRVTQPCINPLRGLGQVCHRPPGKRGWFPHPTSNTWFHFGNPISLSRTSFVSEREMSDHTSSAVFGSRPYTSSRTEN